jgi:hypothetical protein
MLEPVNRSLTAAQEILFAAHDLDLAGKSEFTEWDLTVASWKRNPNRFGCRGYESEHPDHKRVMMEIMGNKKDNPVRVGTIEKTRPNCYRLTNLGRSQVDRLRHLRGDGQQSLRSPQSIYDAVAPYYQNSVFRKHSRDAEEPRMWLGAASFLQLANSEPRHLEDRLRATERAIDDALAWVAENGLDQINRGVSAGGEAISKDDLVRLKAFFTLLQERFAHQLEAIRRTRRQA